MMPRPRPTVLSADTAADVLAVLHAPECVTVSRKRGAHFNPAVVCHECQESIDLTEGREAIAAFVRAHPHAHDDTDPTIRPCPKCHGTADRIGEDTHGRPYFWCADCGTEFQTDPE